MGEFIPTPSDYYGSNWLIDMFVDSVEKGCLSEETLVDIQNLSLDEIGSGMGSLLRCKLSDLERQIFNKINNHLERTRFK